MRIFLIGIMAMVVAGCGVTRKQLTRDEWIDVTTKTYSGVTETQALAAAGKFLRLLDGDDFIITNKRNNIVATKNTFMLLNILRDTWTIEAETTTGGVLVTVDRATFLDSAALQKDDLVVYEAFWARMDYLLGKRDDWMTCKTINKKLKAGETWGDDYSICNASDLKGIDPTTGKSEFEEILTVTGMDVD